MINQVELISFLDPLVLFYKELINEKERLSNNNFPSRVADDQIKLALRNFIKITQAITKKETKLKESLTYVLVTRCVLLRKKMKMPLKIKFAVAYHLMIVINILIFFIKKKFKTSNQLPISKKQDLRNPPYVKNNIV